VPGNYAPGESPTPALDRLAAGGIVFSRYIATGNPSPRGFFGINAGVIDHREAFIVCCSTSTEFDALPLRMRRRGYFTLNVWGANPSFDNVLFWSNRWYDRIRTPEPSGPLGLTRALPDDRTIDMAMEEIAAHDRERPDQPLFAYVATAGTHEPYTIEPGSRLSEAAVRAIAAEKDPRRRYRMVLRELDAEMGRMLAFLDARRTTRPRIVIVVGDHADAAGDSIPPEFRGLPYDAVEWTAALIAGPSELIGPPRVDSFHASHADLMPTVLDLVGDAGPTIAMGTSLLADLPPERRTALSVSGFGYRMDKGGWSLYVRRATPEVFFTHRAFTPLTTARPSLEGSPFTPDDVRRLWEGMNTWTWLIEQNRVWRASVLGDPAVLAADRR
jgi:arylsulfatase A-like enzyme